MLFRGLPALLGGPSVSQRTGTAVGLRECVLQRRPWFENFSSAATSSCGGEAVASNRLEQLRRQLAEEDALKAAEKLAAEARPATGASALRSWASDADDDPPTSLGATAAGLGTVVPDSPHRAEALLLYRQILRATRHVPTHHRQAHILRRARREFEEARFEQDPEQVRFLLQVGETHLDTIRVQGEHLSEQFNDIRYRDWKT
jgi:hypothetical protein